MYSSDHSENLWAGQMERLSILFFNLCFFAVLVGSIYADSSATTETLKNDMGDVKTHNLLKDIENDPECSLMNESHMKDAAQLEQHNTVKNPSYLSEASNAFTTSVSPSSSINNTQHSDHIKDQKGNQSDRKQESIVDLSHDILLDPSLTRSIREAEKSDVDYTTASVEDIPDDAKSHGNIERSIDSSLHNSNLEGDLSVAEDRYQSQYPYWYRTQGQFPNERYRANDRREPYRNYLRYPVFPGK